MFLLLLYLPILSFFICCLFGRKIGKYGVYYISNFLLLITCCFSFIIFNEILSNNYFVSIKFFSWFNIGILNNMFFFNFDIITSSMIILVNSISFLVHFFSIGYMMNDAHTQRFFSYLSLFTFFMIILVTSNNLIQLFIGWEGVGLCSYLLINFWFTRTLANKSAIKAMILNKIGDLSLLLGIILLWVNSGLIFYKNIFPFYNIIGLENYLNIINILLFLGVVVKSAQIGFHMWLPDAMEGPTPVSALIHAATMVTAGVFLIIRLSPLFDQTPLILILIVFIGSITAFFSASIGITQNDIKKVVAYSTCSQLGYMVMICGFSCYNSSLFHLMNHGFFKALLFLSAGSVIHSIFDDQDIRKMGNMNKFIPFSYISILIGSLSLMGLPFLTGFYSKDLLLELIYGYHFLSFSLWLGLSSAFLTAFYSFRLIFKTFFLKPRFFIKLISKIHEGSSKIIIPLFILSILSILLGYILLNFVIFDYPPIIITNYYKFLPFFFCLLAFIIIIIIFYNIINFYFIKINKIFINIYSFIIRLWYIDNIISIIFIIPTINIGFNYTYKIIDNQILEIIGPYNIIKKIIFYSSLLSNYHLGKVISYIFIFIFVIIFYII